MKIKLSQTYHDRFSTYNSSSVQTDADSLPTLAVYEDGGMVSLTGGTVTKQSTGLYRYQFDATTANGFETGKFYNVIITATVGAVTHSMPMCSFQCVTKLNDDLVDLTAAAAGTDAASKILTTPANTLNVSASGYTTAGNMRGTDSAATETKQDIIDTIVDAIKAKTDNLPASPAAVGSEMDLVNAPNATAVTAIQNGLATAAALTIVDTVVDAIKIATDTLPASPADETTSAAIKVVTDILNGLIEDVTGNRFTTKALEQAPSGSGAFSETEKDDLIADVALVKAKTDLITADTVVTVSIIDSDNNITINQGDDYLNANSRKIDLSNASWSLTGSTVLMKIKSNKSGVLLDSITATIVDATNLYVELTSAITAAMETGTEVYEYEIEQTDATGYIQTLLSGQMTVDADAR